MTNSRFLCRMDVLSCALRAAVKVAGKDELAYVRLHRLNEDTLSISSLGPDSSFRVKIKADFIAWDEQRDDRVEISKHAAASLAGYEVKTPSGNDNVEPTVSVTIGDEHIRVQDETGLFQIAAGRDEHRLADTVLPGDHERIFTDAARQSGAPFWITPEALTPITGVAKTLNRRIVMWVRSQTEEGISRWYVLGDDWQMTVSRKERCRVDKGDEDESTTVADNIVSAVRDVVTEHVAPRIVSAAPSNGIA